MAIPFAQIKLHIVNLSKARQFYAELFEMATCVGFRILLAGLFICAATETGAAAGLFTPTGDMSVARVDHTATLLPDGTVLIAGGSQIGALNSAERYDPALGTFSPTGSMAVARYGHSATLLANGKVLIAGGFNGNGTAEIYNPATGTFSPTGNLVVARYFHMAAPLADGRVLLAGGQGNGVSFMDDAEIYDPTTGTFSAVGDMTVPRWGGTSTLLADGRVLILGGYGNNSNFQSASGSLPDAEIFDPSNGTFHAITNMTTPRVSHTATRLSDGTVLIAGGENDGAISGTAGISKTAEIYDPVTDSFSATLPMQTERRLFTATLLSNGQVLVAGGVVCASGQSCNVLYTALAELYDPVSGAFSPTGSMTLARSEHTATLLANGSVLVTGGDNFGPHATAELFGFQPSPPSADLSITKTASVDPAEVGRIFTYNINVSNAGPDAANAVTVTDTLPAGVTFTSATPSQGSCTFASGTVTCHLGSLALNGSASVALQVKPRQTGTLMNTASVTAAEPDTDGSNNNATSSINIIKSADLKVAKTDSADPIFVGEQTTYTMLVTNLGPLNGATGIVLTDSLPSSMTFVSATTTQGSLITPPVGSNGIVTANLGSLAVGAQATVTVTVKATQSGAIVNTATVSSNEADTSTANNTATQTTTVKDAALQKVLLTKQVLTGGCENTTGNVYLTGPAPSGGVTVPLSSNITGASVPASVFIPAGQTVSPAFNVTTHPVVAKQVGLITAGSGAGSVSRGITINVGGGSCPP
jgi:uncharacterized repeat protein (TIGR01451 family)